MLGKETTGFEKIINSFFCLLLLFFVLFCFSLGKMEPLESKGVLFGCLSTVPALSCTQKELNIDEDISTEVLFTQ